MISTPTPYDISASTEAMEHARQVIPGGLVSRVRWRETQIQVQRASGPYLWDLNGNRYVDCVLAHGPVLLGHSNETVNSAAIASMDNGIQFAASIPSETEFAERLLGFLPYGEQCTLKTTGTEAVQLAIKLARVNTGRKLIVKFQGHYHGWIDPLYVNIPGFDPQIPQAGQKAQESWNLPVIPGAEGALPPSGVLVSHWNDVSAFEQLMNAYGSEVAAVIMEPLVTGYGTYRPSQGYLESIRAIAHSHGALVIFDEVVSGVRVARGGAAELLNFKPDIGVFAKAIANGFPLSAIVSSKKLFEPLANGRLPAAGTYSGTPFAVAAGNATLAFIDRQGSTFYSRLDILGQRLANGFRNIGKRLGLPIQANQIGGIVQLLWGATGDLSSVKGVYSSKTHLVYAACEQMIRTGVYISRKGLFYLSSSHTEVEIDFVLEVAEQAIHHAASLENN